jgi:hypothetical protein
MTEVAGDYYYGGCAIDSQECAQVTIGALSCRPRPGERRARAVGWTSRAEGPSEGPGPVTASGNWPKTTNRFVAKVFDVLTQQGRTVYIGSFKEKRNRVLEPRRWWRSYTGYLSVPVSAVSAHSLAAAFDR